MKNLIVIVVCIFAFVACSGHKSAEGSDGIPVLELDSLMKIADQFVDKKVMTEGHVIEICKHAGKRCFMVGESKQGVFRVEAKEKLSRFERELVNCKLRVKGVIREKRVSHDYIDQLEKEANERGVEEDPDSCKAELENIQKMRDWMTEHGKDYYAVYYMDGHAYDVLK